MYSKLNNRPIYLVIMTHVEGDEPEPEGSLTCGDLTYQEGGIPPIGEHPKCATYEIDLAGTELFHELLQAYTDSRGKTPRLFIEPVGNLWHTEADPKYGGRFFRKYDYLELGAEFGIQGHNIYYSGEGFCWYKSPQTPEGIRRKFVDMHYFAERVYQKGHKVNAGLTFTGGHKLESPPMDPREAEYVIDHVAYTLGYRISFEDCDGHWQSKPDTIDWNYASPFAYEADYGDGVRMFKVDFNGMITADAPGNSPRCEKPEEALARYDRTVAAQENDRDPTHIYYFATTFHSNVVWIDHHIAKAGLPLGREGAGLRGFMDGIQSRMKSGVQIMFVTPKELWEIFKKAQA